MSSKRIALCLSGQPRSIKEAYPCIKKNLIDTNQQVDVFLHCWYNNEEIGKQFSNTSETTREEGINIVEDNVPNWLKKMYQPVATLVEVQEDFSSKVKQEYLAARDKTNPFATFSMWTSIQRCNDLKKQYENDNNFIYDIVVRCRYDVALETPIVITDTETELHTSGYNSKTDIIEDIIFYAPSDTMDFICNLPEYLDSSFQTLQKWNNEALFYTYTATKNILVIRHPEWRFTLIRGKRKLSDTIWYFFKRLRTKLHT